MNQMVTMSSNQTKQNHQESNESKMQKLLWMNIELKAKW